MSLGQRKNRSFPRESYPCPPKHQVGALSTELWKLVDSAPARRRREVMGLIPVMDRDFFFFFSMLTSCWSVHIPHFTVQFQMKISERKTTVEWLFFVKFRTTCKNSCTFEKNLSFTKTFHLQENSFSPTHSVMLQCNHNFKHFFSGFVCCQEAYGNNKRTILFTCEKTKLLAIQAWKRTRLVSNYNVNVLFQLVYVIPICCHIW